MCVFMCVVRVCVCVVYVCLQATASKAFPSNAALCKQLRAQADQEYAQLAKTRPELVARFASSDNNGAATFPVTANGAR